MGAWQNGVGAWYALLVAGILLVGPTLCASRFRRSEDSGENCKLLVATSQQCFNKAQEAFTETMKHEGDPDPDTCTLKTCVYLEALSECSTHLLACEGEEKVQKIKDEKMEEVITNRDCKKWNTEKCNIMKMYMDRNPDIEDESMDYGMMMDHQVEDEKEETDDAESDDQDDEERDDVESDDQDDEEKADDSVTEIVEAEAVVIEEQSAALVESVDTEPEDGENVDETDTEPDANNDKNPVDGNAKGVKENDKDEDDNENKEDDIEEDKKDESDDDDAAAKTNDKDGDDNDNENKEDDSEEENKDESDDDDDDYKKASGKDTMMLSTTLLFAIVINSIR